MHQNADKLVCHSLDKIYASILYSDKRKLSQLMDIGFCSIKESALGRNDLLDALFIDLENRENFTQSKTNLDKVFNSVLLFLKRTQKIFYFLTD